MAISGSFLHFEEFFNGSGGMAGKKPDRLSGVWSKFIDLYWDSGDSGSPSDTQGVVIERGGYGQRSDNATEYGYSGGMALLGTGITTTIPNAQSIVRNIPNAGSIEVDGLYTRGAWSETGMNLVSSNRTYADMAVAVSQLGSNWTNPANVSVKLKQTWCYAETGIATEYNYSDIMPPDMLRIYNQYNGMVGITVVWAVSWTIDTASPQNRISEELKARWLVFNPASFNVYNYVLEQRKSGFRFRGSAKPLYTYEFSASTTDTEIENSLADILTGSMRQVTPTASFSLPIELQSATTPYVYNMTFVAPYILLDADAGVANYPKINRFEMNFGKDGGWKVGSL